MKRQTFMIITLCAFAFANAQTDTSWHHKKCAVVLTYDDALNVDLDNALPLLDSLRPDGRLEESSTQRS
jgi:peptidoglycan-N-acetylglucosamine deacetylase